MMRQHQICSFPVFTMLDALNRVNYENSTSHIPKTSPGYRGDIASVVYASEPAKPELRPAQKAMQARAGWMKTMGENTAAKKFDDVAKDAEALSAQTKKSVRATLAHWARS